LSSVENEDSLPELHDAANVLLLASDTGAHTALCDISSQEARKLLQRLHARIDQRMAVAHDPIADADIQQCSVTCRCGLYATVLERKRANGLSAAEEHQYVTAAKMAARQSKRELQACVKKTTWFCTSSLLSRLREELR
jgi:hypothetical protein